MKFKHALKKFKQGEKMTREGWGGLGYLELVEAEIIANTRFEAYFELHGGNIATQYNLTVSDVYADDWQVYEVAPEIGFMEFI